MFGLKCGREIAMSAMVSTKIEFAGIPARTPGTRDKRAPEIRSPYRGKLQSTPRQLRSFRLCKSILFFLFSCHFVCFVGSLKFQAADVSDAGCLPYAKQSDENGKAHRDFGGCDGDNEKNENLCVVIGQPI